jgi:hypothetical protein
MIRFLSAYALSGSFTIANVFVVLGEGIAETALLFY